MSEAFERVNFPSIRAVAEELMQVKQNMWLSHYECESMEVRLQVTESSAWHLWSGDPSYDPDHRGYWGNDIIDARSNCREVAKELLEQAKEQYEEVKSSMLRNVYNINKIYNDPDYSRMFTVMMNEIDCTTEEGLEEYYAIRMQMADRAEELGNDYMAEYNRIKVKEMKVAATWCK